MNGSFGGNTDKDHRNIGEKYGHFLRMRIFLTKWAHGMENNSVFFS